MKVSVLQENLVKGLSVTSRSTTTKSQLPVLGNILLATKKGKLKLSATDLETGVNFYLGAKVEKEGAITIPSKVLLEFVSSLSAGKVDLEVKGDSLRLSSGNFKAEINGIGAAEFPKISGFSGQPSLVFEMKDFKEMVDQVVFAAATDEGRPVLTGVRLAMGSNGLVLAATDGYRLSVKKIKDFKFKELKKALIIPARTLQEVARIKDEGKVKILLMKKKQSDGFWFRGC
ncbi:DNA polymerase III subunit beta [Candidatus Microgenomates bacterium]|nr:DNA polymerase III subunit beta [Candidatus Microgenomates bacterium]